MPSKWATTTLREIAEFKFSNVDKHIVHGEAGVRLCNYLDVYRNRKLTANMPYSEGSARPAEIKRFAIQKGDVLITKDSETPDDIGVPALVLDDLPNTICGYHLAIIRPNGKIDPCFLALHLQSAAAKCHFLRFATGVTRFGLGLRAISTLPVPLPPVDEQQTIARIVDAVDVAIEVTRTAIIKAGQLKQGLLQGIFERTNVPLEKTGAYITEIRYGTSQASNDKGWGCPTLRIPNVIGGTISTDDLTCVDTTPLEVQRYLLKHGDLLMVRTNGNPSYIGRSAVFQPPDERQWLYASYLIRVRFDDRVLPRYVDEYLKSGRGRRELFRECVTTSAGNYNINTKSIRAIPIHVPDKDQQVNVVRIADAANLRIAVLEHQRSRLERLKRGLIQDLLTGRVRVKIPASSGNGVVRSRT